MFKKYRAIVLVIAMVLSLALALVGCGGANDNGGAGNEGTGEGGGTEVAGLALVKEGAPQFQFVYSKDISPAAKTLANSTIKSINKVMSKDAASDYETDSNENEIEIIIGTPSYRGDEYAIDCHYLGPEGYAVKVVGTKVLVLYGSDNAAGKALDHLKETVFGINAKTKKLTEVVVTEDKLKEEKQVFTLASVTVAGNDIKNYVLEYPTSLRGEAQTMQNNLYSKVGIWLPKGNASANQKAVIIREIENGGEGSTPEGFNVYVDENENLIIETEFAHKISDGITKFLGETFFVKNQTSIDFGKSYNYSGYDARNIFYEDFGAKGNGKTDDFEAIKACHAYANQYGHTVNGKTGATYYIGKNDVGTSAIIQTDVNWNGCKFTIDDHEILQPLTEDQNFGIAQKADPGFNAAIFIVQPEKAAVTLRGNQLPVTSLAKGATNIGYEPGEDVLLILYNSNVKHFIRYGANADNGKDQHEIILVDKYGNIDPSTPVQWEYETITKITVNYVNDTPITISGGEYDVEAGIDNRAYIGQIFNHGRSFYTYYMRNIVIERSNVVLENVIHDLIDVPEAAAPYSGFTTVRSCNNVTITGFVFECPPQYKKEDDAGVGMGSYEITANEANKVTYSNSVQSNFYEEDGSVIFHGLMGTNFCKNLLFDGMHVSSFDAHCGVYHATVRNSTVEHLNFIGAGNAVIENTVIYGGGLCAAMNLRDDYGSTWDGDLIINGLEFRFKKGQASNRTFTIVRAAWYNHYFGYTVHFPHNITLNDVSIVEYTHGFDENGNRWEQLTESSRNKEPIRLIYSDILDVGGYKTDISAPTISGGQANKNPVVPIQSVVVNNTKYSSNPVNIMMPTGPAFDNTSIVVDGVKLR